MKNKLMVLISVLGLCMALLFISISEYNDYNSSNVMIVVKLRQDEDPFKTLKSILPNDTGIVDVAEINRASNEYRLTVKTRRPKEGLLNFLRGNRSVERAEACK